MRTMLKEWSQINSRIIRQKGGAEGMNKSKHDKVSGLGLVDAKGASRLLGITEGSLANWRCTRFGGPKFIKIGRLVRYRVADLEAYLTDRTIESRKTI